MLLYGAGAGASVGVPLGAMTGTLTGGTAVMLGSYAIAGSGPDLWLAILFRTVVERQRQALLRTRLY